MDASLKRRGAELIFPVLHFHHELLPFANLHRSGTVAQPRGVFLIVRRRSCRCRRRSRSIAGAPTPHARLGRHRRAQTRE